MTVLDVFSNSSDDQSDYADSDLLGASTASGGTHLFSKSKSIKTDDPEDLSKMATQSQSSTVSPRLFLPDAKEFGRGFARIE